MRECPFCREAIHDAATRCRYCTADLKLSVDEDESRRVTYVLDRDLIRFAKFAAAIGALFVIVGAYAFGFRIEIAVERARQLEEQMRATEPQLQLATKQVNDAARVLNDSQRAARKLAKEVEDLRSQAEEKVHQLDVYLITSQRMVTGAGASVTPSIVQNGVPLRKRWRNGSTLTIAFLDGDANTIARVKKYMQEWIDFTNLHLDFTPQSDAQIRVTFAEPGSWSFVGTDALAIPRAEPTINLGNAKAADEMELRRTVLHEFGHTLGLIEEMNNPNANIPWNKKAVYAELTAPPANWSRTTVDQQIFTRYTPTEFPGYRGFDPKSIMMVPIPAAWTGGKVVVGKNTELSDSDKLFIAQIYPRS